LANIDRVIVDAGNPLMQTVAGKMELAQTMLQAGMIKMPDELLSVINTGNLQPFTQGKTMELLAVQQENELLRDGKAVKAIITDDAVLHIMEHKSVLADPDSRADINILNVTLSHMQEHIDMLKDPNYQQLLQLMGQPQMGQPAQQPPLANGAMPGQSQIPGGDTNAQVETMQPNQPSMPTNPLTKQQWNPQNGGAQ
jgi:hypothetical protein